MKKPILIFTALLASCLFINTSFAQTAPAADVTAALQSSENGAVAAFLIKAANLNQTLSAAGPFTVFAPTNDAFSKLSTTKIDSLLADPAKLATAIKGYVVVGKYAKDDLVKALNASKDRKVALKTVDGGNLTLSYAGKLVLTDDKGNSANVLLYNLQSGNGVVHGLSDVLTGK